MIKDFQYYKNLRVFTDNQLSQIRRGLVDGVDVRVYADPKYIWWQMDEIRIGILNNVDVSIYADTKFTWLQMQHIRIELQHNEDPTEFITKITIEAL